MRHSVKKTFSLSLIVAVLLISGCVQQDGSGPGEFITEPVGAETLANTEWKGEFVIVGAGEKIGEGSRSFNYVSELHATGEFTFKATKNGNRKDIVGSGTGRSSITVRSTSNRKDISSVDCIEDGSATFTFEVTGTWDDVTEGFSPYIAFGSLSPLTFGAAGIGIGTCTHGDGGTGSGPGQAQYIDILGKYNFPGSRLSMLPKEGVFVETSDSCDYHEFCGEITNTITITKVTKLSPLDDSSFDVDVNPHIIEVKQGETAEVDVVVKLLRGESQIVDLTVTDWSSAKITSWFDSPKLETGKSTKLYIRTTCETKEDDYLHTAQGAAGIRSSVDAVTVKVTKSSAC